MIKTELMLRPVPELMEKTNNIFPLSGFATSLFGKQAKYFR